ncbi:hypothetical protein CLOBOL_04937 [Enterocloster bolteae ATCC BAA-613]|uniref:Uncharacterized protein n=1 Tax=Enterocloster bolteae (strain ATCC BAA-613 / DSM 15670 / CCUG 46953 / JCM 12243 / WAL 16351) TaxID=411902 RepID=A8RXS7_ENTBW|nr:hypothetical protein CLOBOL_04937 [Enterocloster bolteae ATCC BAA-613]
MPGGQKVCRKSTSLLFLRQNGFTRALHKNYRNFVEFTSAVVF